MNNDGMKIAILGSGGREHALAWMMQRDERVQEIYVIPGNGGTDCAFTNVPLAIEPPYGTLIAFLQEKKVNLVVVGPENYLSAGVVDALEGAGIMAFGPCAQAAALESSKKFAKMIMQEAGVKTAAYKVFTEMTAATQYLEHCSFPIVLKANGLCQGKGVIIAEDKGQALAALRIFWEEKRFGEAAEEVLIEEFLSGPELSVQVITDGKDIHVFPAAQDHKRLLDNDEGPNTGGMGAYTPLAFLEGGALEEIEKTIIRPTLQALASQKIPFRGVLYVGLMKDPHKGFQVLEFNVRFGDPECQCVLPLMTGSLVDMLEALCQGRLGALGKKHFYIRNEASVTVILASEGYPHEYSTGMKITGLEKVVHSHVFHAGTRYDVEEDTFYTTGGRVLALTATGETLADARAHVYADAELIDFTGKVYRGDIGLKGIV